MTNNKKVSTKWGAIVAVFAIALAPVAASAATATANTTINAVVASTVSITTSGTVTVNVTPTASGSASSASDTVTVATNNSAGYNLSLSDADTVTNLVSGANTIAAHAGTFATPTTLANNAWGYRIDSAGTFGAGPTAAQTNQANLTGTYAGVTSSAAPVQVKSTATTATADVTTVWYGVKADTTKPNGTYTDAVTYTAVTN